MRQPDIIELTERLDRLERANRSLRIGIAAALLVAVTVFGVGEASAVNAQPRTLDVERLNVVDQQGVVRASLFVASPGRGEINFNLNDENGQPLISMGGIDGTSIISMLDAAGRGRILVQVGTDGMGQNSGHTVSIFGEAHGPIWSAP